MSDKTKGYIYGSIAAATYGMNPLFALPLYKDGMDADSVLFFRYLLALPILLVMIRSRGRNLVLHRHEIAPLVIVGLLLAVSSLSLFLSYNYMPAGIASTMLFVYPIMVAVIMAVCFKEKITPLTAGCILLALSGIALLYKGEDNMSLNLTGVLLVMCSALAYAIYLVAINRPRLREIPTVTLTFYTILFGLSIFLLRTHLGSALTLPHKWYLWGNLLALALFPTAVSFIATTRAIQYIGSTPTAILGALEPLTAIFFGITLFGERLTIRIVCGIVLILSAVTLIIAAGSISAYMIRLRKLFPKLPKRKQP